LAQWVDASRLSNLLYDSAAPKLGFANQGKWEADIVSKRSNQGSKVIFEVLPDGSFNATPPGDTTIVDKDKYQVLDEGHTVKLRSQLFDGEAVCTVTGDAMQCESDNSYINFKGLQVSGFEFRVSSSDGRELIWLCSGSVWKWGTGQSAFGKLSAIEAKGRGGVARRTVRFYCPTRENTSTAGDASPLIAFTAWPPEPET
jgi:hypothetical protein